VVFGIILEHLNDSVAVLGVRCCTMDLSLPSSLNCSARNPWGCRLIFQRGSTVRQPRVLTTGYATTPLSCATPHTELWHTPYWAAPHPILSFGTPHIELRHTPYWAAPHPILSYATPHTELCHTPYWAMPHPMYVCMYPGGPVRQPYSYLVPSPHRLFTNFSTGAEFW
jgi:hypothetical protein